MNDETLRAMALIDWVAANSWLAIAYVVLVVAAVAFAANPWASSVDLLADCRVLCIPCVVYWWPCIYIGGKCLPMNF